MNWIPQQKGRIVEGHLFRPTSVGALKLKVHGIQYILNSGTAYSIEKRIPPYLLVSTDERIRSIGKQLELLLEEVH